MKNENLNFNTSYMDVLKYVCFNLQNNLKVAKTLYSVRLIDGRFEINNELVKIIGIVYDDEGYWLLLEDKSRYSFNLIIEELNNGYKLEELLFVNV